MLCHYGAVIVHQHEQMLIYSVSDTTKKEKNTTRGSCTVTKMSVKTIDLETFLETGI